MKHSFELEQDIMSCWGVVEDLDALFDGVMDKNLSQDAIANIVLGLKGLYDLKFQKLFSTFEKALKETPLA